MGRKRGNRDPRTALLYCSSSALGGSGHSGVEWSSVVISTVLALSGIAYSCHRLKHRMPACPSHPIPSSHYISGPSSLAISDCSLLLQVFYNNKGYHSMPTYLNALNNAILRANLPKSKGNPAAYGEDLRVFKGRSMSGTALGYSPTTPQSAVSTLGQAGYCPAGAGVHTALRYDSRHELFVRPGLVTCPRVLSSEGRASP